MSLSFARALLRLHLDALDTFGAAPDAIDIGLAEDNATAVLTAHVGDEGLARGFDLEGVALEVYRDAIDHPAKQIIFIPNGRVLDAGEVMARLNGDAGNKH